LARQRSAALPWPTGWERSAHLPGRQRQRVPALLVAFRQCITQSPVPGELVPGDQLLDWEFEQETSEDVDRFALLPMPDLSLQGALAAPFLL
jgi:hypothetical protein